MLTCVVWLLGQRLSRIELAPDQGASWYYWRILLLVRLLGDLRHHPDARVGLSRRSRVVLGATYLVAVLGVYSWRGWNHLFEVTWIPIIEYGLVAVVAGLVWIGLKIADAVRSRSGSDSPDLRSPTAAGRSA